MDYSQQFISASQVVLTLKKHHKWRYEGGALLVKSIKAEKRSPNVPVGSGGAGIQVAQVLQDPSVEESERIMFSSHTKVRGGAAELARRFTLLCLLRPAACDITLALPAPPLPALPTHAPPQTL